MNNAPPLRLWPVRAIEGRRTGRAGDIILLYGDESEALTHPYLARAYCAGRAGMAHWLTVEWLPKYAPAAILRVVYCSWVRIRSARS